MNAAQKRMLKRLLTGVAALVLIVAAAKLVKSRSAAKAEAAAVSAGTNQVTDGTSTYTELNYSNGTATLSFHQGEDGVWVWTDEPDFPLDDTAIHHILDAITGLTPQQTIAAGDTLETYGLDEPSMTLTATEKDGESLHIDVGDAVSGSAGGHYLLLNGDVSTVYVVEDTLVNAMSGGVYEMMVLPELPELTAENLSTVYIAGAAESGITALRDGASSQSGEVTWRSAGENVSENKVVQALVAELGQLKMEGCHDYYPSEKAVSLCGFDAPQAVATVRYTGNSGGEAALTLSVGALAVDGAHYCVRMNDDPTIYTVAKERLTTLLAVAANGLAA